MTTLPLSVVLVAPNGYGEVATTVRHLRAQTIAAQIELVIVAPQATQFRVPEQHAADLGRVVLVDVPDVRVLARARATGVTKASAPLVAFTEDHCFPEPGWASSLIAAHARGYDGVAPEMKNANPATALSWAAMFLHFAAALEPQSGFETDWPTATHNMSYRRDVLLEQGDKLEELMVVELFLHRALRARGHKLWVEPAAATRHVNASRFGPAVQQAWLSGKLYGGLRCAFDSWSLARRILYAAGSPLIPILRLRRLLPELRRTHVGARLLPRVLPIMTALLVVYSAGEAFGYLFGVGAGPVRYSDAEHMRHRFVRAEERALWT